MPCILVQMQDGVFRSLLLQRFQGKPFEELLLPLEVGFRVSTTYLFQSLFHEQAVFFFFISCRAAKQSD